MNCPACSSEVSAGGAFCSACGAVLDASSARTRTNAASIAGVSPTSSFGDARFLPGAMLAGRYRIVGLLGRGGMGEVYRADDLKLGQPVALKFLPAAVAADPDRLARLLQEVRIARQVSHPNVCRVYDVGETDGHHYLSMEYVDGEDLATLLRRIGRLPDDKALQIARQLCAGLAAAHEQGILHRDLKPANVMIDGRGRAKVTDFGLAGLTETIAGAEVASGTPQYMAPEQLAGRQVSERSDVYALGLVLYELFTGKKPFGEAALAAARGATESTPTSPSSFMQGFDPTVERVLLRCLETDPASRPPSALAVAAALPGGDPLAAALAAGETPSPEMVAAAGPEGGLRPGVAVACLIGVLLSIVAALPTAGAFLHNSLPFDKSFAALQENAREIAGRLGYGERPADTATWFQYDLDEYLRLVRVRGVEGLSDAIAQRGHTLAHLVHRRGPHPIAPLSLLGHASWDDPSPEPGEVGIWLDLRGELARLRVVPPEIDDPGESAPPTDWSVLFELAGLDLADFEPTEPTHVPETFGDERAAWSGPLRVEAAGFHGKPVYFRRILASGDEEQAEAPVKLFVAALILILVLLLLITGGGLFLAVRNLRLDRGDRKGALRLALAVFGLRMAGWVLTADHVGHPVEIALLAIAVCGAVTLGLLSWIVYIAAEPYVRRLWPEAIVSWTRLVAGRLRDPLVGRDVLVGLAANAAVLALAGWVLWGLGRARMIGPLPSGNLGVMRGGRFAVGSIFGTLQTSLAVALSLMMLVLLFRMLLRKTWIAVAVIAVVQAALTGLQIQSFGTPAAAAWVAALNIASVLVLLTLLVRFGLLAIVAYVLGGALLQAAPSLLDSASPHFGTGLLLTGVVVAIAGWACKLSLAGRSLMRDRLLPT